MHFFRKTLKKDLSSEGQWEFLNMWYIMIIANDVLIILGSAIKEQIERQVSCNICLPYVQKLKVKGFSLFK
jgi:mucolipin